MHARVTHPQLHGASEHEHAPWRGPHALPCARTTQTCLGVGPARCLLLTLRKTNILLDCGLWGASGVLQQWHGGPGAPGEGLGMPQYLGPLLKVSLGFADT